MRGLIRPALFWVARIGLVLSMTAWVVGQSWPCGFCATTNFRQFIGYTCEKGLAFGIYPGRLLKSQAGNVKSLGQQDLDDMSWLSAGFWGPYYEDGGFITPKDWSLSEIRVLPIGSDGAFVSIRHWLIVTVFALFYGALKWVCRKREVSDEG